MGTDTGIRPEGDAGGNRDCCNGRGESQKPNSVKQGRTVQLRLSRTYPVSIVASFLGGKLNTEMD